MIVLAVGQGGVIMLILPLKHVKRIFNSAKEDIHGIFLNLIWSLYMDLVLVYFWDSVPFINVIISLTYVFFNELPEQV